MIKIRQIKVNIVEDSEKFLYQKCAILLKVNINRIKNIKIVKKSIDARYKPQIFFIYEVFVDVDGEESILKRNKNSNIFKARVESYSFPILGKKILSKRPIIVEVVLLDFFVPIFWPKMVIILLL